jgi:hypothetical protein
MTKVLGFALSNMSLVRIILNEVKDLIAPLLNKSFSLQDEIPRRLGITKRSAFRSYIEINNSKAHT